MNAVINIYYIRNSFILFFNSKSNHQLQTNSEVTQMLQQERKKLQELYTQIENRRDQIIRLGHRAAAMDVTPYRRLCEVKERRERKK